MREVFVVVTLILPLQLFAGNVNAESLGPIVGPSFDCGLAEREIEKAICRSPDLALIDQFIHDAYSILRAEKEDDNAIVRDQREWIRSRNGFQNQEEGKRFWAQSFSDLNQAFAYRASHIYQSISREGRVQLDGKYLGVFGYQDNIKDSFVRLIHKSQVRFEYENTVFVGGCASRRLEMAYHEIVGNGASVAALLWSGSSFCGGTSIPNWNLEVFCQLDGEYSRLLADNLNDDSLNHISRFSILGKRQMTEVREYVFSLAESKC